LLPDIGFACEGCASGGSTLPPLLGVVGVLLWIRRSPTRGLGSARRRTETIPQRPR